MRRLSAHLGYLFRELPFGERLEAAVRAGFAAVEHSHPLPLPTAELRRRLDDLGLAVAQLAAGMGDAARGEKGLAALPGREGEARDAFARALDCAESLGCPFVHPMAGVVPADVAPDRAAATFRQAVEAAVERCRDRSVRVLVEAISHAAVPGYHLHRLADAFALARAVPGASVLLDSFHAAANGEDAVALVRAHGPHLGHVHVADHPGRHEPGTGAIDFRPLHAALDGAGYAGAVGFEYLPAAATEAGLGWMAAWGRRRTNPHPSAGASA